MEEEARIVKGEAADSEADTVLQSLLNQLTVARATDLARSGHYTEAESILLEAREEVDTIPSALDLKARIRAQQGNLPEAEKLWIRANRLDPSNIAFLDSLNRIEVMRKRPAQRIGALGFASILIAIVLVSVTSWVFMRSKARTSNTSEDTSRTHAPIPSSETVPPNPLRTPSSNPSLATDLEMAINVPGVIQTRTSGGLLLEFERGLFIRGTTLKSDTYRSLKELGVQLKSRSDKITVEIIGTTDATPMSQTSRYRDNIALGLDRARVVYDYLRTVGELKSQILTISSRGEQPMSYSDDITTDSLRKRTVILYIRKQQ